MDCARHGMQGGFHAIGDAAIGTVLDGFAGGGAAGRGRADPGGAAPHRARGDHGQAADRAGSWSSGSWRACSRRSTGCGAASRHVRAAAGPGPVAGVEPDRGDARRGGAAGVRVGFAGDAAGPVGDGAGGDVAPQPGAADQGAGGVRGAHPWRVAGRCGVDDEGVLARAGRRRSRCGTPRPGWTAGCRCCAPSRTRRRAADPTPLPVCRRRCCAASDLRGTPIVSEPISGKLGAGPADWSRPARRLARRPPAGSRSWIWRAATRRCRWSGRRCGWPG